jgi:ribosomal protein S12 methylthiotransferase
VSQKYVIIDIPLQHISDSFEINATEQLKLKTTKLLKDFRAAVPGMAIRTTLIVGYPEKLKKI